MSIFIFVIRADGFAQSGNFERASCLMLAACLLMFCVLVDFLIERQR